MKGSVLIAVLLLAGCSGGVSSIVPAMGAFPAAPSLREDANGIDAASPIKLAPAGLALLGTGSVSAQHVTITEKGYIGKFSEQSTCKGVATVAPASGKGPALTVTVTATKAGSCAITFADAKHHTAKLAVSDTTASFALSASSISPKSASVAIALLTVNGKKPGARLQTTVIANLPKCSVGCTVSGPQSPAGTDVFSLTTFDAAAGKGNQLATGTATFKIVAAKSNSVPASLAKIPKFLSFGTIPSATAGTAFTTPQTLPLIVQDADHATIAGTYSAAITVSDNDTSSAALGSALAVNGTSNARSVTLKSSSDKVVLAYGGLAIAPATLTASAKGVSATNAEFAPSLLPIAYAGPEDAGTPEIDLYNAQSGQPGYSGSFTVTQPGWSGTPFNNNFSYSLGGKSNNCSSFAVTPSSGTAAAYTVTVGSSPVAGTCVLTITGAPSASAQSVVLTYTTNSIGINGKRRRP